MLYIQAAVAAVLSVIFFKYFGTLSRFVVRFAVLSSKALISTGTALVVVVLAQFAYDYFIETWGGEP